MINISLPRIIDSRLHDGQILSWPDKCRTCSTKECQKQTNDILLCSYGYNYTSIDKITLAGFVCPDHKSSSKSKSKNIKIEKSQIISTHILENQRSALRRISIAEHTKKQEIKSAARDKFLSTESFRDEFISEIKEDILKGLSFVHDYKQINATIAQNINVIIETRYQEQDLAVAEAECNTVTGLKQVHHAATPLPLS